MCGRGIACERNTCNMLLRPLPVIKIVLIVANFLYN